MTQLGEAFVPIRATLSELDKDLSAARDKIKSALGPLGDNLGKAGALALGGLVAGAAAAATGVAAIGAAAFAAGNQLDSAFDTILVGTGATGAELEGLKGVFRDVFASVPTQAGPAAEVIAELNTRLGLTGSALGDVAKPLLEMTRLLGGDAKTNTELFTRVMGDWGITSEDAAATLDRLFVAGQQTGIGIEDLMAKVVQFGAPMRLMGFSLEDSIALFGKWEQEGVNAELVMGSLRIAAGKFAREGEPLRDSLLETFSAIQMNTDASAALALGMEVFGARAGPDMVAAIREGRFEFEDLLAVLGDADGAILGTAAATADWGEKLTVLKNKATLALEPLGTALLGVAGTVLDKLTPALESALPAVTQLMERFGTFVTTGVQRALDLLPNLQAILQGLVDIFVLGQEPLGDWSVLWEHLSAVVGPELAQTITDILARVQEVVGPIVEWVKENVALQDVLIALGVAIAAFVVPAIISVVTAAAPVVATFLAVIAVAALLRTAWEENWGGIQEKTAAVWAAVQPLLLQAKQWLEVNIPIALEALRAFWVDTAWPAIQRTIEVVWPILLAIFEAWKNYYFNIFIPTIAALKDFWVDVVWPAIQRAVEIVWPVLLDIFTQLKDWIVGTLIPTVQDLWTKWTTEWWPDIQTALTNAWTVIEAVFKELDRWVNTNIIPWIDFLRERWEIGWGLIQAALEAAWAILEPIWKDLKEWLDTNIPVALEALKPVFEGAMSAIVQAVQPVKDLWDAFTKAVSDFWTWITSHTFSFKISLPDLPSWAIPGSPLPIHTAWKQFAEEMSRMTIAPTFDLGGIEPLALGLDDDGPAQPISYNSVTTVNTTADPLRVLRASRHLDKLGAALT